MSHTAIKFENISKQYRLGLVSTRTLSHDLNRWWQTAILRREDPYLKIGETNDRSQKGDSEYVWALRNIDFEVKQGDVLGIIGKNGAGKSTLLKILSRVTTPTTGAIKAKGRIASLLEVGTGFHPEFTGRENIYMNGCIMGMSKAEITRKLDEIIDFAGVERYIDTPVKRYSSGMTVRLGFSIAAHLEPEILVVDEVLAVGDAEFQKKAIGKMQDVSQGEGRTVLFVSHNMGAVANLCNKGIILNNGMLHHSGDIKNTIELYINSENKTSFFESEEKHSDKDVYFKKISIVDNSGKTINNIPFDKGIICKFEVGFNCLPKDAVLSFTIIDSMHRELFTTHKSLKEKNETIYAKIPKKTLLAGNYYLKPVLHIPNISYLDRISDSISFSIEDTGSVHSLYKNTNLGTLNIDVEWS
jgi:lipopolysaccharide transport system ATP-binding protein